MEREKKKFKIPNDSTISQSFKMQVNQNRALKDCTLQ